LALRINNISKQFGRKQVLKDINLKVAEGEVLVLLGPSGCGKTTLLRVVAGLEQPDDGTVEMDGQELTDIAPHVRGFGFVFQDYALFPHKSVYANVAFGLRMKGMDSEQLAGRTEQILALVGLEELGARRIQELSGGERQRVALARALAPSPVVILMDEPLGALDRALRERLMLELRTILKSGELVAESGKRLTTLYVSHDQAEAFALADRVAVMNEGRIVQVATPEELHLNPRSEFVARFIGMENIIDATVASRDPLTVESALGSVTLPGKSPASDSDVKLLLRPDAASLSGQVGGGLPIVGQVTDVSFRGRYKVIGLDAEGSDGPVPLRFEFRSRDPLPAIGSAIRLEIDLGRVQLISRTD